MESKKLLGLLLQNGENILKSGHNSDPIFEAWYTQAEQWLPQIFGQDWKQFIIWENYSPASSYVIDRARLERALDTIKNAQNFLLDNAISPETSQIQTKVAPVTKGTVPPLNIFIVHGHDDIAKLELKNYLQNTLHLSEPIILHEKPNHGQSIMEKFEKYALDAALAFVLLTPDDILAAQDDEKGKIYRARQNVIFELGYFLGLMGRKEGRVILLYKGILDIPSDISGLIYINISSGIDAAGEKIRKEIAKFVS